MVTLEQTGLLTQVAAENALTTLRIALHTPQEIHVGNQNKLWIDDGTISQKTRRPGGISDVESTLRRTRSKSCDTCDTETLRRSCRNKTGR